MVMKVIDEKVYNKKSRSVAAYIFYVFISNHSETAFDPREFSAYVSAFFSSNKNFT